MQNKTFDSTEVDVNLRDEFLRYLSFWPYFLILLSVFLISSFLFLRYTEYSYQSTAVIEIMDEAQDSEMALPTELTVFNRSMINLENEINILNSFSIHEKVVKDLEYNVVYKKVGKIKSSSVPSDFWFDEYELDFKIDLNEIKSSLKFVISIEDQNMTIDAFNNSDDVINSYRFASLTTLDKKNSLPFDLTIKSDSDDSVERVLIFNPIDDTANYFKQKISISKLGKESDQLSISVTHENPYIAKRYLNGLLRAFDYDGINDRQSEYKRTIEFVNEREKILKTELEFVELRKQNFKQANNLSDLTLDAGNNIDLKFSYNSEIFQAESQKSIANYLSQSISKNQYNYLPINIGLDNFDLNNIIADYNTIVRERNKLLNEAGPNNVLVKSLQSELDSLIKNISISIKNYLESINLKINDLKNKELEFEKVYNTVPENEKILRSIERELTIKEALYLLLLQKREEASINLAVVKPTIKVIDYALVNSNPIFPIPFLTYSFAIVFSLLVYILILFLWFWMDNKIHNKDQILKKLHPDIPVVCEIPFIRDTLSVNNENDDTKDNPRSVLNESIRMLISNLKYVSTKQKDENSCKTYIFTSSIKGEGKTLASVHTAINLSTDTNKKVLLIGTDLRNPQIHKIFGVDKNLRGLTEILYQNKFQDYEEFLHSYNNLDILYSGSIPPNPNVLLSGNCFKNLLNLLKDKYDFIIIDSAPCLLVSDTYQILNLVDSVVYLFRANFTESKIIDFINDQYTSGRVNNINLVLNAVGNSASYGYKYGYQYGYKYGYRYGYNYGYGYGYGSENK